MKRARQLAGSSTLSVAACQASCSAATASAKKKATGLVDRVQAAIAADERAKAATIIPDRPKGAKVKGPGSLSTLGSFAEPITLPKLTETPLLPDMAT